MGPTGKLLKSLYPPIDGRRPTSAPSSAFQRNTLSQKSYHGRYARDGGAEVWAEEFHPNARRRREARTVRPLPLHLEVRAHSPTGFAWGYSGSGPAQLALALLLDATENTDLAVAYYQTFKQRQVSGWQDDWSITAEEIQAFIVAEEQSTLLERSSFPPS